VGRESVVTGKTLSGSIQTGTSLLQMSFYDNSYVGADTANISIEGSYQST